MDLRELLIKAKNGDKDGREEIVGLYYHLIVKESKRVFLKDHSFEDIVQIGVINLLNAIDKFDVNRNIASFPSYALWSIKNGYRYLCRRDIRYNNEHSLNFVNSDGIEFGESLVDAGNIEEDVLTNIDIESLNVALSHLDSEEYELIKFLFFSGRGCNLSKYAKAKNKDYYYCTCLKRRVFNKLRKLLSC